MPAMLAAMQHRHTEKITGWVITYIVLCRFDYKSNLEWQQDRSFLTKA